MGYLRGVMSGIHLKVLGMIKLANALHCADTATSLFFKPLVSVVRHAQVLPAPGIAVCSESPYSSKSGLEE